MRKLSKSFDEEYDVVVIGSGIGGLTCSAFLVKSGRRVKVFERNLWLQIMPTIDGGWGAAKISYCYVPVPMRTATDQDIAATHSRLGSAA